MSKELRPNCVELVGYKIWGNRRFERWHQPFLATMGPLNGCFDANCPYPYHCDKKSFTDPYAREFIDLLLKDSPKTVNNMLIQTDCDGLEETLATTFDQVTINNNGEEELTFQERSIPWNDIRYVALINNPRIKPFSKQGGQLLFREELARLTGATAKEVCAAMSELNSLNWLEHLPVRMRFPEGTWIRKLSHYFDVGIADEFKRDLEYVTYISPTDVALTFGIITQQDRLPRLRSLILNWTPEKPDELAKGLEMFSKWYLKCVPDSEKTVAAWKQQWINMFKLQF